MDTQGKVFGCLRAILVCEIRSFVACGILQTKPEAKLETKPEAKMKPNFISESKTNRVAWKKLRIESHLTGLVNAKSIYPRKRAHFAKFKLVLILRKDSISRAIKLR